MTTLTWTSTPPTVPGWYWIGIEGMPSQTAVCQLSMGRFHLPNYTLAGDELVNYRFAGPIPEPQEPGGEK